MREVIGIFRDETVEKLFQITSRGGIGIFHDDDAATGVLNKNCDCSVSHSAVVDLRLHVISDFVETFAMRAHFELVVKDVHAIRRGPVSKTKERLRCDFIERYRNFAGRHQETL